MISSKAARTREGGQDLPDTAKGLLKAEPAAPARGKRTRSKTQGKVRTWLFRGSGAGEEFELGQLTKLAADNKNMAWVDLSDYSEADLKEVAGLLDLHPVAIEATLAPWQRPRIDSYKDYFFLSVTLLDSDLKNLKVHAGELDLFMGRNFLVTAHRQKLPFLDKVIERVHLSPELVRYHTAFVLYIVLDELIDYYQAHYEELEERIEKAEETALRNESDAFLSDLLRLKRYVFLMGRLAEQHKAVFAAFTRPDFDFISGNDVEPYFRDLQQRLSQFVDRLFAARDSVNGAFDIYVSQISHRTNKTMKLLTVVSTVLLPATLIVGFFGTGFSQLQNQASLYAMLLLLFAVPTTVLLALHRARVI